MELSTFRVIRVGNKTTRTPMLVPSFSSKASKGETVKDIMRFAEELITDEVLISAYDIHYEGISSRLSFPSLVILDSGGYEASEDYDLSSVGVARDTPKAWSMRMHMATLDSWDFSTPTVLVSYDHPKLRHGIDEQIARAKRLFSRYPEAATALLFKPQRRGEAYVDIDEIIGHRHELSAFSILGFTEKELGPSLLKRMETIAKLRLALQEVSLELPIHIFGSLDTISTPLYFLAGADIFDGLTWLRYAFLDGSTIYKYQHGALTKGIHVEDYKLIGQTRNDNYYYMLQMKSAMGRFITTRDYSAFQWNAAFFKQSFESLRSLLGVGNGR